MAKNITIEVNGVATAYTGKSVLEVPLTDGSGYGRFQDVDEFDGSGLEAQVVSCIADISDYGGLQFTHTAEGRAVYVGVPNMDPDKNLTADRFAWAIMVEVFEDGVVVGSAVGYARVGMNIGVTMENNVITVTGSAGSYLKNTEVQYTFRKMPAV